MSKLLVLAFFSFALSAFSAEVCTFKDKSTWINETGQVKCTNFRGIPVKEFQISNGKKDGLERSFYEGKIVGIAWYETSSHAPVMEITFNDYGEVEKISCGKKAFTDDDAKYCGFKAPYNIEFKNFKGEMAKKVTYKDGEIIRLTTFFSSGKVMEEMTFDGQKKKTAVYHEDGTLSAEAVEQDKKPVLEKEYYTENRLKSESVFTPEGEDMYLVRKKFYRNGKLQEEGKLAAASTWSKEYYIGELKRYHDNGKLSSSELYDKKGDLEGVSTFFDNDGHVVVKRQFSRNQLIKEEKL